MRNPMNRPRAQIVLLGKIMQEQHKELQYEGDILLTKTSNKDSDFTLL